MLTMAMCVVVWLCGWWLWGRGGVSERGTSSEEQEGDQLLDGRPWGEEGSCLAKPQPIDFFLDLCGLGVWQRLVSSSKLFNMVLTCSKCSR
jgi:hypothetical protein